MQNTNIRKFWRIPWIKYLDYVKWFVTVVVPMGNVGFELIWFSIRHSLFDIIFHDLISPYLDFESRLLVTLIFLPFLDSSTCTIGSSAFYNHCWSHGSCWPTMDFNISSLSSSLLTFTVHWFFAVWILVKTNTIYTFVTGPHVFVICKFLYNID